MTGGAALAPWRKEAMFNRKVTILVLLVFSLVGCATHESRLVGIQSTDLQSTDKSKVVSLQMDIDDLSKVYNQSPTDESTTLYVFDIDDTLLTGGTDFGSDYWFGWQFDAKNQNKVACPLDLLPITVNIISIHKTQVDAAAIFNSIKDNKIIVTSRMRYQPAAPLSKCLLSHQMVSFCLK